MCSADEPDGRGAATVPLEVAKVLRFVDFKALAFDDRRV
jgi:hypothetical protein